MALEWAAAAAAAAAGDGGRKARGWHSCGRAGPEEKALEAGAEQLRARRVLAGPERGAHEAQLGVKPGALITVSFFSGRTESR